MGGWHCKTPVGGKLACSIWGQRSEDAHANRAAEADGDLSLRRSQTSSMRSACCRASVNGWIWGIASVPLKADFFFFLQADRSRVSTLHGGQVGVTLWLRGLVVAEVKSAWIRRGEDLTPCGQIQTLMDP